MCRGFATNLANFLTILVIGCALAALISDAWVRNPTSGMSADGRYYNNRFGVVRFYYQFVTTDYYNYGNNEGLSLSQWPSSEWAASYVCMIVGGLMSLFALLFGMISCCLSCICLCCLSLPFSIIACFTSFISFVLYLTAILLFASKYNTRYPTTPYFCGRNSSSFNLGNCEMDWGMYVCIGAIVGAFLTTVLYGLSCCTDGKKKNKKNKVVDESMARAGSKSSSSHVERDVSLSHIEDGPVVDKVEDEIEDRIEDGVEQMQETVAENVVENVSVEIIAE